MASMASMDASNSLTPASSWLPSTSPAAAPLVSPALLRMPREKVVADPEAWRSSGFPPAVTACVLACAKGEHDAKGSPCSRANFARGHSVHGV